MANGLIQTGPCLSGCALRATWTTTTIPTSTIHGPETPSRSISNVYLVFSSYQVVSTFSADAACNTAQKLPVTLSTPFSVASQLDNATELSYRAQSSLRSFLGITECTTFDIVPTALIQVYNGTANLTGYTTTAQQSSLSSTSLRPNTTSIPPTSQASRGLTLRQKDTIAVATAIPIIALSILGVLAWRRARKRRLAAAAAITATDVVDKHPAATEVTQPYLQQKAELEAAERRKHELEAHGIIYEMVGEDAIYEVATGDERRRVSTLQELRGTEHSKELEAPTNL